MKAFSALNPRDEFNDTRSAECQSERVSRFQGFIHRNVNCYEREQENATVDYYGCISSQMMPDSHLFPQVPQ